MVILGDNYGVSNIHKVQQSLLWIACTRTHFQIAQKGFNIEKMEIKPIKMKIL